jgi:hypothetical protein
MVQDKKDGLTFARAVLRSAGRGISSCPGRLSKIFLQLLKRADEQLEFIVGLSPGDLAMFKNIFDLVIGLLTIFRIKKTGLSCRRKIAERF